MSPVRILSFVPRQKLTRSWQENSALLRSLELSFLKCSQFCASFVRMEICDEHDTDGGVNFLVMFQLAFRQKVHRGLTAKLN